MIRLPIFLAIVLGVALLIGGEIGLEVRQWTPWMSESFWGKSSFPLSISWGIVFGLMGVGAWLVWEAAPPEERILPMLAFGSQLLVTILWSFTHEFTLLPLLVGLLLFNMGVFWYHSRPAAIFLFPYFAWVLFATIMNAWI